METCQRDHLPQAGTRAIGARSAGVLGASVFGLTATGCTFAVTQARSGTLTIVFVIVVVIVVLSLIAGLMRGSSGRASAKPARPDRNDPDGGVVVSAALLAGMHDSSPGNDDSCPPHAGDGGSVGHSGAESGCGGSDGGGGGGGCGGGDS